MGGNGPNMTGLEMALRSMGLGSVLDAAKQLAESGAVLKIVKFAEQTDELTERLARIEKALKCEPPSPAVIEGTAQLRSPDTAEPGSGSADSAAA